MLFFAKFGFYDLGHAYEYEHSRHLTYHSGPPLSRGLRCLRQKTLCL